MNVPVERVREQIVTLLTAWGMDPQLVPMLMDYENSKSRGKLNLRAVPRVVREGATTALVDADAGLGHPAAVMAMGIAIEKAKAMGVGVASVFNSHHFGAAGYYAAMASKEGLVGMVTSATRSIAVVPTRAAVPVLGTNPIAFAAPARRNAPFLLDMATSTVANNKIKVHELNGRPLPPGWVVDERGRTVTDPTSALQIIYDKKGGGGQTPLGGTAEMSSHKGYGLALMAHILGGTLSGASFSPIRVKTQGPGDPDRLGHFFLAIDPKAFRPEGAFEDDLDAVIDVLHATPPVLVPGDPENAARARRLREGIPIPPGLAEKIRKICQRAGVPFLLA